VAKTAKPAKHQGMNHQNMIPGKQVRIQIKDQRRPTYNSNTKHRYKPVDRKQAYKVWMQRIPDASLMLKIHIHVYPNLGLQPSANRKRYGRAGGHETQVSPQRSRKVCHVGCPKPKVCETNKTASQTQNRETASSASRHTVAQRTPNNKNEMGKQTTRSKTKRNLLAEQAQGNILQINEFRLL
jgi:hypothetical protein